MKKVYMYNIGFFFNLMYEFLYKKKMFIEI